jgi:streptomycin 6-kinase
MLFYEGLNLMSISLNHYLDVWDLSDPQLLATTATSHVYTVTSEGTRVVLKLLTEVGAEERQGALALGYFDGQGAVRLLREDDHAHLLEYAEGNDLVGLVRQADDDHATAIIGDVLNQLHQRTHKPIPEGLTPLKIWFRSLFERATADQQNGLNSLYTRAALLADYLISQNREVRVLHGDIHHENIRHHLERGWLAFDPKGLVGERTFDAANTLYNPFHVPGIAQNEARILRTAGILADKLGIELSRVLAFAYIYGCLSTSWYERDGQDASYSLAIVEQVEPHVDRASF